MMLSETKFQDVKRKYLDPLSDHQDQLLFFGCFILGAISIWNLKRAGFDQFYVTVVPILLMCVYIGAALVTKRYRLREDRVGDNAYYLGFLFTLVSLAYALHVYDPSGAGATEIITGFGIAIFSTIFGLFFRVLLNQMRQDPVEFEREARFSLGEATREMSAQLGDISAELALFKRKILQITEEAMLDVTETAKQSISETSKGFSTGAGEVINTIQAAFSSFTDHSTKLNEIAEKNVLALQDLFARIERIEAGPDLLTDKFNPIIEKFDEVASDSLKRSRGHAADIKKLKDYIDAAVEASGQLSTKATAGVSDLSESLKQLSEKLTGTLGAIDAFASGVASTTSQITEGFSAVEESSARLKQSVGEQGAVIKEAKETVTAELVQAQAYKEEVVKLGIETQQALTKLQGTLVSLAQAMVEGLRDRDANYSN